MTTIRDVRVCRTPSAVKKAVDDLLTTYWDTIAFREGVVTTQPLARLHYRTGVYPNGCGRYAETDIMVQAFQALGVGRSVIPVLGEHGPGLAEVQWTEDMLPALVTVSPFVVLTAAEGGEQ